MMTMRLNEPYLPGTQGDRTGVVPSDDAQATGAVRDRPFEEWDRSEWVGEGQEPEREHAHPGRAETEPRWTKWEWVGEGQGRAEQGAGRTASEMPEGENALSGNRHNPGMAHWGGTRFGRRGLPQP